MYKHVSDISPAKTDSNGSKKINQPVVVLITAAVAVGSSGDDTLETISAHDDVLPEKTRQRMLNNAYITHSPKKKDLFWPLCSLRCPLRPSSSVTVEKTLQRESLHTRCTVQTTRRRPSNNTHTIFPHKIGPVFASSLQSSLLRLRPRLQRLDMSGGEEVWSAGR